MPASVLFISLLCFPILLCSAMELLQPTIIEILDGSTFTLNLEYCAFSVRNDLNQLLISINTRCYCVNQDLNRNSITILHKNNDTHTKATLIDRSSDNIECSIPGPTLLIRNGTVFDINLVNNLIGSEYDTDHSYPYEFRSWPDVTNLHLHGVHVDPQWDNVFDPVNPQSSKVLHFEIPSDHYPGTNWYHSHFHQATDYHVNGGVFGALIVNTNGDNNDGNIDDFFGEFVMNIHFYYFYTSQNCICGNKDYGQLEVEYAYSVGWWVVTSLCFSWCANPLEWRLNSGFVYDAQSVLADSNGKVDLPLINGQYEPTITITANQWYRLRLVNSNGQFYAQFKWPDECDVWMIGMDGILFQNGPRDVWLNPFQSQTIMDPGCRTEIAINCAVAGAHYEVVFSKDFPILDLLPRYDHQKVAFFVDVVADDNIDSKSDISPKLDKMMDNQPPNYAIPPLPAYLYDSVNDPSNSPFPVTDFCPCWTYEGGEFDLTCHWYLGRFGVSINNQMWEGPEEPILYVCKDVIYEFRVNSLHPLHMHTSQFQVVQDLPQFEPQNGLLAMEGDFRDTISTVDGDFYVRYQASDFEGPIVTHCHFLPHEDEGMIVYFQIVDCLDENIKDQKFANDTKLLNPYNYNPLKNKNIPEECDIFDKNNKQTA